MSLAKLYKVKTKTPPEHETVKVEDETEEIKARLAKLTVPPETAAKWMKDPCARPC